MALPGMNLPDKATAESMLKGATPLSDISKTVFDNLFGTGWENIFLSPPPNGPWSVLFQIFVYYNAVTLALLTITLFYMYLTATAGTAYEGEPLGRRYHTWWTPVRSATSVAVLMPWPGVGLSIGQGLVLMLLSLSIDAANYVTSKAINYMDANPGTLTTLAGKVNGRGSAEKLATDIMDAEVTQIYLSREVSAGSATYDAPHYSIEWKSTGLLGAAAEAWQWLTTPVYADNGVAKNGPEGGGLWVITFQVPPVVDSLIDEIGTVAVPCQDKGSAYCSARVKAVTRLIDNIFPIAKQIVQGQEPDRAAFETALQTYLADFENAVTNYVKGDGSQEYGTAVSNLRNVVDNGGWVMLFSWYWNIAGALEHIHDMAQNMSATSSGPDPGALAGSVLDDYNAYLEAASQYRTFSLATAVRRAGHTDDGWFTRLISNPFLASLDMFSIALMEGDPVINLKTVGDYIIGAIDVAIVAYAGKNALTGLAKVVIKALGKKKPNSKDMADTYNKIKDAGQPLTFIGSLLTNIMIALFLLGAFLAYYLPSIPFFLGMISVVGWVILVVETLFAFPVWAFAHGIAEGEGIAGDKAGPGYMLFTNIAVRPMLMVGAFFFTFFAIRTLSWMIGICWMVFYSSLQAHSTTGPVTVLVLAFMIGAFVVIVIDKIFGLITHIPETIMRWIGGSGAGLGEEGTLSHARNVIIAGVAAMRSDGVQIGGKLLKPGGKPGK